MKAEPMNAPDTEDLAQMYVEISQGLSFEETSWPEDFRDDYNAAIDDIENILAKGGQVRIPGEVPQLS